MFDQRMNFDALEPELDSFLQHPERVLWTVPRAEPHEAMNASRVPRHCVGDVPVGLSIIRGLSDTDGKSDDSIYSSAVHRLQHVLRHELHDRRNLVDGELFSRAHVRVRVYDLDRLSFDIDHVSSWELFMKINDTKIGVQSYFF